MQEPSGVATRLASVKHKPKPCAVIACSTAQHSCNTQTCCHIMCDDPSCMQTKELLRIAEEEEEQAPAKPSTLGSRVVDDGPEQRWDCESVLSLRSNLDNHPGVISEQSSRRYKPASGKIKLAAKTGENRNEMSGRIYTGRLCTLNRPCFLMMMTVLMKSTVQMTCLFPAVY